MIIYGQGETIGNILQQIDESNGLFYLLDFPLANQIIKKILPQLIYQ